MGRQPSWPAVWAASRAGLQYGPPAELACSMGRQPSWPAVWAASRAGLQYGPPAELACRRKPQSNERRSRSMSQPGCPRCLVAMQTISLRESQMLLCSRCEGSFSEEKTIVQLLRQPDLRLSGLRPTLLPNLASPHPEEDARDSIPCPICAESLTREAYDEETPMLVDRCEKGHGVWLDDGELGHLLDCYEQKHPQQEPSFFEAFRRLLGRAPRVRPAPKDSLS